MQLSHVHHDDPAPSGRFFCALNLFTHFVLDINTLNVYNFSQITPPPLSERPEDRDTGTRRRGRDRSTHEETASFTIPRDPEECDLRSGRREISGGKDKFPSGSHPVRLGPDPIRNGVRAKKEKHDATHDGSSAGTVRPAPEIPDGPRGARGVGNPLPVRRTGRVSAFGADSRDHPVGRREREGMTWNPITACEGKRCGSRTEHRNGNSPNPLPGELPLQETRRI